MSEGIKIANSGSVEFRVIPGNQYAVRVSLLSGSETLTLASVLGSDESTISSYTTSDEEIVMASTDKWKASVSNGGAGEFEILLSKVKV